MFVFAAGIRGHYHKLNLQIVLNTPKNPHLNQATQKNACQMREMLFPPQKIPESKISNPNERKTIVNSWVRCLENSQLVITSGFPTVNFRK